MALEQYQFLQLPISHHPQTPITRFLIGALKLRVVVIITWFWPKNLCFDTTREPMVVIELLDTQVCSGSVKRGSDRWRFLGVLLEWDSVLDGGQNLG